MSDVSDERVANVTLRLPSTLSAYSGGRSQIALKANTIEQLLESLARQHPSIWERLCTDQGSIREHVKIFVNNQLIRGESGLKTELKSGQEVIVLPTTFSI